MDKIFSVDFIERAIDLKLKFDTEVIDCYPEMSPFTAMYDALLLRWYWPQALKKNKEEISSEEDKEVASTSDTTTEDSDF